MVRLISFLNPLSPVGGVLGRLAAPSLAAASVLLAAPFSPVDIAGFVIGGVDISVFSGQIDQARWEAAGTEVAVVGAWHGGSANPYAESNLRDARNAGKITATYCVVTAAGSAPGHMDNCRAAAGDEWQYLNFVAVDAETPGLTVSQIISALQRVQDLGGRAVLYSGCWYVNGYLAGQDLTPLAAWPYWNAHYDGDPDVDYPGCIPDAPLMGEQYEGSGTRWGIWSDINVFDDVFIRQGYPFVGGPSAPAPLPAPSSGLPVDNVIANVQWATSNLCNYCLYRPAGSWAIYLLDGGEWHWVSSPAVMERFGWRAEDVVELHPAGFLAFPMGEAIR